MTREEARIIVEQLDNYLSHTCQDYGERDHEAMMTAIKVLEPCEDTISRADAINKVTNFYTNCERLKMFRHTSNEVKQTVTDILCDLPPVTPKPKMGHWIFDEILDRNYYCSECKFMGVDYWDYCPYCGCRMVEPQESEEQS